MRWRGVFRTLDVVGGFSLALLLLCAVGVEAAAARNLVSERHHRRSTAHALVDTKVAAVPEMWASNGTVGSVTPREAKTTEKVVVRGLPAPVVLKEPPPDPELDQIKALDCETMDKKRADLEKEYDELKVRAQEDAFEKSRLHATAAKIAEETAGKNFSPKRDRAEKAAAELDPIATREFNRYARVEMELLFVIEQFGLKCGVKDKYCTKAGEEVNQLFVTLQSKKADLANSMMEAGWLKGESQAFLVKADVVAKAQAHYDNAWAAAKDLFEEENRLSYLVMIKAAACGLRPPTSPWSSPASGCDLRPEDPELRRLMKEDPHEFVRQWKEMIGRKAGVKPEYIRVDSDCLGGDAATEA